MLHREILFGKQNTNKKKEEGRKNKKKEERKEKLRAVQTVNLGS